MTVPTFRYLTIAALFGATLLAAQVPTTPPSPKPCGFSELYRAEGWIVPGLKGAAKQESRATSRSGNVVVSRLHAVQPHGYLDWAYCMGRNPGRLQIVHSPIRVKMLYSYAIGGQIFAYYVGYVCQAVDHGVRADMGCEAGMYFMDVDGAGRFTVEHAPDSQSLGPPFIPEWVKREPAAN